jgi:hypothetical protein
MQSSPLAQVAPLACWAMQVPPSPQKSPVMQSVSAAQLVGQPMVWPSQT